MPCFSKQDILHPSAQLSTVLLHYAEETPLTDIHNK